jgi:hypothetical protein
MRVLAVSYRAGGKFRLRLMSSFLGRNSRRRRVLNEEALSASSAHLALRSDDDEPAAGGPRYSDAAGVEHHPQVTDFLPRRYRSIWLTAIVGVATTATVEALYWFAVPATAKYGFDVAAAFDLTVAGGVAGWLASVLMVGSAATCLLIYSLRRHRIDDVKGRYRIWLAAAVACACLSLESVAPIHRLIAAAAAYHTGWTALRGHAAWWLALGGLPLAWIAARAWLDARESRLAAATLAAAYVAIAVAVASYLGVGPAIEPRGAVMVSAGATLIGYWMLLIGIVSYGRFVVLDAQGLIPIRARHRAISRQAKVVKDREVKHVASRSTAAPSGPLRAFRESLGSPPTPTKPTEWVDGSAPEPDGYEDGDEPDFGDRKLTKAERKRLRKLKARDRAA